MIEFKTTDGLTIRISDEPRLYIRADAEKKDPEEEAQLARIAAIQEELQRYGLNPHHFDRNRQEGPDCPDTLILVVASPPRP